MSPAIEGLKPQLVWKYFAEIAQVPRPSKHEERIRKYVLDTAKRLGLSAKVDKVGNVLVKKPASAGKERVPSLCLQGHLDMVCEKNAGKVHDFMKDPIELVRKDNLIVANGTTLGADNGIAVAANLAIMEDSSLVHGPLELLFTIDEETGLTGAANLEHGFVESKTLINLDSEEEGELFVGCSGGEDTAGFWKGAYDAVPKKWAAAKLSVSGLLGGHSGLEIDKGRGNAIKILNRVLIELGANGVRLAYIEGGNKRNAIPRECHATVWIPPKSLDRSQQAVKTMCAELKAEVAKNEPDLEIALELLKGAKTGKVFKRSLQLNLCRTISALPHGVLKMSPDISWLVETSTNVAVITTDKKGILLATSQRSSIASELDEAAQTVTAVFELGGGEVKHSDGYPGWKPDLKSNVLKHAIATYKRLYGKEPAVKAVHAGLECGIIGEKYPGIDMVSFGPTMMGVHSPDERLYIDTVDKFWRFLAGILESWG
jgi:dipeptidase D